MHPLAGRRARAYLRDCLGYLGLAAATVPLGLLLNRAGSSPSQSVILAVSALPPAAATLLAAVRETRSGTPGQRRQGLTVVDATGERPDLGHALIRNVVKIGLPWQAWTCRRDRGAFRWFSGPRPTDLGGDRCDLPRSGGLADLGGHRVGAGAARSTGGHAGDIATHFLQARSQIEKATAVGLPVELESSRVRRRYVPRTVARLDRARPSRRPVGAGPARPRRAGRKCGSRPFRRRLLRVPGSSGPSSTARRPDRSRASRSRIRRLRPSGPAHLARPL